MRKMYKKPKIETMPVKPTEIICSSNKQQNVGVSYTSLYDTEIY